MNAVGSMVEAELLWDLDSRLRREAGSAIETTRSARRQLEGALKTFGRRLKKY